VGLGGGLGSRIEMKGKERCLVMAAVPKGNIACYGLCLIGMADDLTHFFSRGWDRMVLSLDC
jgi:hypothetical protein